MVLTWSLSLYTGLGYLLSNHQIVATLYSIQFPYFRNLTLSWVRILSKYCKYFPLLIDWVNREGIWWSDVRGYNVHPIYFEIKIYFYYQRNQTSDQSLIEFFCG